MRGKMEDLEQRGKSMRSVVQPCRTAAALKMHFLEWGSRGVCGCPNGRRSYEATTYTY